eukprot:2122330-Pleurochrysis_carterae.AAC.1
MITIVNYVHSPYLQDGKDDPLPERVGGERLDPHPDLPPRPHTQTEYPLYPLSIHTRYTQRAGSIVVGFFFVKASPTDVRLSYRVCSGLICHLELCRTVDTLLPTLWGKYQSQLLSAEFECTNSSSSDSNPVPVGASHRL